MKVVQDEEINPAVNARIARDVGFDRRRRSSQLRCRLDGQSNERERRNLLRAPILEHFEIRLTEVGDEPALLVGHRRIRFNVVDLRTEGHRRRRLSGRLLTCDCRRGSGREQ